MNKTDRTNILNTAKSIMSIYINLKDAHKNDAWEFSKSAQGYRNSLEAMKRNHLILDYNLSSGEIHEALS